jgi:hypothetical protein
MKFACSIYGDEEKLRALTGAAYDALAAESRRFLEELRASGQLLAAERLERSGTARSVRVRDGDVFITDGPFVETKEKLGGFILIEARDADEALRIATKLPPARLGGVEVRPVWTPGA